MLIEESLVPVTFISARGCGVKSGKWFDPYTGRTFTNLHKLDVDHVVPLAEAHRSGAWKLNREKKKRIANYLKDKGHLIAVSASANRRKSDKDPAEWLPSNKAFGKEYARIWIKIKVDWGLTADKAEIRTQRELLKDDPGVVYPGEAKEVVCTGLITPRGSLSGMIKKSKRGICHDPSSRWYKRTKHFTAYKSLDECLASGGRLPKK